MPRKTLSLPRFFAASSRWSELNSASGLGRPSSVTNSFYRIQHQVQHQNVRVRFRIAAVFFATRQAGSKHHDGTRRILNDTLHSVASQQPRQPAAVARSHDNKRGMGGAGLAENHLVGAAFTNPD